MKLKFVLCSVLSVYIVLVMILENMSGVPKNSTKIWWYWSTKPQKTWNHSLVLAHYYNNGTIHAHIIMVLNDDDIKAHDHKWHESNLRSWRSYNGTKHSYNLVTKHIHIIMVINYDGDTKAEDHRNDMKPISGIFTWQ